MIRKLLFASLLLLLALATNAQSDKKELRGKVTDSENNSPIEDASVVLSTTGKITPTDKTGNFAFSKLAPGKYTIIVSHSGYAPVEMPVDLTTAEAVNLEVKMIQVTNNATSGEITTVTLDEAASESEGAGEVANLLSASRDVFQNISGYGWSAFRFRERGYDSGLFHLYVNGAPFNDPETEFVSYSEFSGLNDVLRNRASTTGLDPAEFAFGDMGGATMIDTRASVQRKQLRASYAITNRIYRHRAMITYNTGLIPGGWALSVSASRRWAQEGYVPGTFYDGYSYFVSADKQFGRKQSLNVTFFGAPSTRGRSADSFQEMYDLAGTNYYNPLWGYQNGKKRNSGVSTNNQPTGILRYDWTPSGKTHITAAVYGQVGQSGYTRFDWVNASNPAPDYNYRLPSSLLDTTLANEWATQLSQDESLRQIDWASLYEANRNNTQTIYNAEGIAGNNVTGKRASYIIENDRKDTREAGANVYFTQVLNRRVTLNGGVQSVYYRSENYKKLEDLLGADYWVDWDFFGQFDELNKVDGRQNDLQHPNNLIYKGDMFGYHYYENIRKNSGWGQAQFSLPHFQFFAAAEAGQTQQWRTGLMQNGRFPNSSLGNSEKLNWNTWSAKGGIVWKANGRNYVYANGQYGTKAPHMEDVLLSPQVRNTIIPNPTLSTVRGFELGYIFRSPTLRARITGYFTEFLNETDRIYASSATVTRVIGGIDLAGLDIDNDDTFLQVPIFFGGTIMKGINRRHTGVEIGVEAKPVPSWTISGAASIGKHIYTSRPTLYIAPDNVDNIILNAGEVYQKNFFVPRTPQSCATVAVQYESPKYWRASLAFNYAAAMWYDFDRLRRTARFVDGLTPESPAWHTVVDQQKAPAAYTVDFSAGKSWRIKRNYYIYLNLGINNLLDNQKIVVSGRDSYRNEFRHDIGDARYYTSELVYAPGLNYFVSIAFKM